MNKANQLSSKKKKQLVKDLESQKSKILIQGKDIDKSKRQSSQKKKIVGKIEQEETERKLKLQQNYQTLSKLEQYMYQIHSWLQRVPATEVYHRKLLDNLKNKLKKHSSGSIISSQNQISGKFTAKLYRIYSQAYEFHHILKGIFTLSQVFEIYFNFIFKNMYLDIPVSRKLSEIIDLELLKTKIITRDTDLPVLIEQQKNYLSQFVLHDCTPLFQIIENSINDFYMLYEFTLIDYKKLFSSLGVSISSLKSGKFPDCPISIRQKQQLEQIYKFVPLFIEKWQDSSNLATLYLFTCASMIMSYEKDLSSKNIKQTAKRLNPILIKKLTEFSKQWTKDVSLWSFLDLIRLSSINYYYSPTDTSIKKMQVKDKARIILRNNLHDQLQKYIVSVQDEMNASAEQVLMQGYKELHLQYYSHNSPINPSQFQGSPGFTYVKEMSIILNFIMGYYKDHIKKVFTYLIRTVLPKHSAIRTAIINLSIEIDKKLSQIHIFDYELSPDKPWGKSLMSIIYHLEKKGTTSNLIAQVRKILSESDSEAKGLIKQSTALFQSAKTQLELIANTKDPQLYDILKQPMLNEKNTLLAFIENAINAFHNTLILIHSHSKSL